MRFGTGIVVILLGVAAAVGIRAGAVPPQKTNKVEQAQARSMLRQVQDVIEKHYYDPAFHGVDLQARFAEADKKIDESPTLAAGLGMMGWAVEGLNDSHTTFIPPMRNVIVDSGWQMEMVGDKCLITAVQPSSDAWKQDLRPGDEVVRVENYEPNRATYSKISYRLNVLAPLAEYHFVVVRPGQAARQLTVKSKLETFAQTYNGFLGGDGQALLLRLRRGYGIVAKSRTQQLSDNVLIWKLPAFNLPPGDIDRYIESARKHETLIFDLRDNQGGADESLRWMIGSFFDRDIHVGDTVDRKGREPLQITSQGGKAFTGKLFVLMNSRSASAAEVFARVVQIEKRGRVIGDQSSGAVGRAEFFPLHEGQGTIINYAAEVTVARLLMTDGADLEGTGVTPDVKSIPTPEDLANGRDPVLAAAAGLAGAHLSPEEAGKLFPVIWLTH
jgi:C-terminal processing protease CtpA/Prc